MTTNVPDFAAFSCSAAPNKEARGQPKLVAIDFLCPLFQARHLGFRILVSILGANVRLAFRRLADAACPRGHGHFVDRYQPLLRRRGDRSQAPLPVRFAAEELQKYLKQRSDVEIPIVPQAKSDLAIVVSEGKSLEGDLAAMNAQLAGRGEEGCWNALEEGLRESWATKTPSGSRSAAE